MKISAILYFILIAIVPKGCAEKESLNPIAYVNWIENTENGVKMEKDIDQYIFTLQYRPLDYAALKASKNIHITKKELEQGEHEIEDLQYFTLRISTKENNGELLKSGITDPSEYYERIEYFTSHMQDDIVLVDGNDTLPCVLFHFERTYGLTPYADFNLAFVNNKNKKATGANMEHKNYSNKTVCYNDKMLHVGTIKLTVKAEALNTIPHLITL